MERLSRERVRSVIVVGFAFSAFANIFAFLNTTTSIDFPLTFQTVVDSLVGPLVTIVAVYAWFTLTRLEARDESQLNIQRLAYRLFSVQYLISAVGYNFIFTPIRNFGGFWTTTALWLDLIGALVSALGLFILSRSLTTSLAASDPIVDDDETSLR